MTIVNVRLFAGLRETIGKQAIQVEVPEGAPVSMLRARVGADYPVVRALLPSVICAINEEYVDEDHPVRAGDAVALIPPVSGGR